jgi:uncharacterized membrane protein
MYYLPEIFAFLVAAAGWFYMFYSRAASNLSAVESNGVNQLRVRLRRIGGFVMMLLAVAFYVGCIAVEREQAVAAGILLLAVFLLMCTVLFLGFVDLKLTNKIRRQEHENQDLQ